MPTRKLSGSEIVIKSLVDAGVDTIFLAGGAHPLGQKVLRASSGAVFHMPFLRFDGNEEEILPFLIELTIPIIPFPPLFVTLNSE